MMFKLASKRSRREQQDSDRLATHFLAPSSDSLVLLISIRNRDPPSSYSPFGSGTGRNCRPFAMPSLLARVLTKGLFDFMFAARHPDHWQFKHMNCAYSDLEWILAFGRDF